VPSEQPARSVAEQLAAEQLAVEARTNRRTALVALRGELDLVTVSKVAEVLDGLEPQADGVRHAQSASPVVVPRSQPTRCRAYAELGLRRGAKRS
jgi:hypothetical protein